MINEAKLSEAVNPGLEVLRKIFETDNPTKEQLRKAGLAASVLSTTARMEASKNSMVSLRFRVAQSILKTPKERKEYLIVSSPELKLLK